MLSYAEPNHMSPIMPSASDSVAQQSLGVTEAEGVIGYCDRG